MYSLPRALLAVATATGLTAGLACSTSPTDQGAPAQYLSIRAGFYHACAQRTDGAVRCWGTGSNGQLGRGALVESTNEPAAISGGLTFSALDVAPNFSCALTGAGAAWCWGANGSGVLGDSTMVAKSVPTRVFGGYAFTSLTTGFSQVCGVTAAGAAYCWGDNGYGEVGDSTYAIVVPTPSPVAGGVRFKTLSAGSYLTCGLSVAGAAYCWGSSMNGAMGVGPTSGGMVIAPIAVSGGLSFQSLSTGERGACGLTSGGEVYCWGYEMGGDFGSDALVPVKVQTSLTFKAVSVGGRHHMCGIASDDSAYCWGYNNYGELGTTSPMAGCTWAACSATPVPVAGGLRFEMVSAGDGFTSCGITLQHEAYCWGEGRKGQLGNGTYLSTPTPTALAPRLQGLPN